MLKYAKFPNTKKHKQGRFQEIKGEKTMFDDVIKTLRNTAIIAMKILNLCHRQQLK